MRKQSILITENRPTEASITGDLQQYLTDYFEYAKTAIELYVSQMFSGNNTTQFENTFGTGVWAWPAILPALNDTTFDTEISTVYFSVLAVAAWTVKELNPVLMCVRFLLELSLLISSLTQW